MSNDDATNLLASSDNEVVVSFHDVLELAQATRAGDVLGNHTISRMVDSGSS